MDAFLVSLGAKLLDYVYCWNPFGMKEAVFVNESPIELFIVYFLTKEKEALL